LQEKGKQYDMLEVSASGSPPPTPDPAFGQYGSLRAQLTGEHSGMGDASFPAAGSGGVGGDMGYEDYAPGQFI